MFWLWEVVATVTIVGVFGTVSANVSQCYHCNSQYCSDTFDASLAGSARCSDIFKNARLYSSRIVTGASSSGALENDHSIGSNNSEDTETLSLQDTNEANKQRTHAQFFDIQRKIWEFFNRGEIDENTQFVCVKANYNDENGEKKTFRGCVPKYTRSISTACDFVNQKVAGASTGNVYGCYTCENDFCNNAIHIKTSMLAFVVGIILKIVI